MPNNTRQRRYEAILATYLDCHRVEWERIPDPPPGSEQPVGHVVDDEALGRIDGLFRGDMFDGDNEAAQT